MSFLGIPRKFYLTTIVCLIAGIGVGSGASLLMPVTYDTSLSFSVTQINKQDTTQYQYDGYYAIQASDLFADTVVSWFQTPSFLLEVYKRANIDPNIFSLSGFTARFKMKKFSSQNLVLKFSMADKETAQKLATAIISHVEERSKELNQNAKQEAIFGVSGSEPVIVKSHLRLSSGVVYGAIGGLAIALFILSVVAALKASEEKPRM